jgi:hypothetical protein
MPPGSSCSSHSLLFPSSFANRFAAGCVRLGPFPNTYGSSAATPSAGISSCRVGPTLRCAH